MKKGEKWTGIREQDGQELRRNMDRNKGERWKRIGDKSTRRWEKGGQGEERKAKRKWVFVKV